MTLWGRRELLLGAVTAAAPLAALAAGATFQNSPAPLKQGARIAALAPGTWLERTDPMLEGLRRRCQQEGWVLLTPPELGGQWRWFSATDQQRASALRQAWLDPSIDALFLVGAGWGSARVLEQGWSIPPGPRWCVGFSDCSALLLAQLAAGSFGAIHGWFGGSDQQWRRLAALLKGMNVPALHGQGLRPGLVQGPLVVSNLTIATSLIGTPWLPSLRGTILVFEDTGEAPYRIDRQLTQWRTSGQLAGVRGIGLGRFSWAEDDVLPGDFSMDEILEERLGSLSIPLVKDLPVGHGRPNMALPLGVQARLDGGNGQLSLVSAHEPVHQHKKRGR
ncbi:S66 peptidase family protein [Synechococcus sp. W4D4]|uniref:S66 peptidase family protein n=1 Tax=Synechococcus sp. W4D4 TaxID=3392294 RepID=UPI0039EC364E